MNDQPRRVRQQDIADAAGVHRTTVTLALQNHPNIPEATRQKIQRIAQKLGYAPDPMLSALAAYRSQNKPKAFQGTLAWITNNLAPFDWRAVPIFREYYAGAMASARSHGYTLETFDLQAPGMSPKRLASVLRARNINGLLVSPQPRPNTVVKFAWESFSAVTFGYSLLQPRLHCVGATQYRSTLLTMQKVRALGYRRIAFASSTTHDERVNHNSLAAYLAEMFLHGEKSMVLPFRKREYSPEEFTRWIRRHRPEAVLISQDLLDMALEAGMRVPGDFGAACSMMADTGGFLAGVCENSQLTGEVAVDYLVAMMHRGERGVPKTPQNLLVEGKWVPGKTLPPLTRSLAA